MKQLFLAGLLFLNGLITLAKEASDPIRANLTTVTVFRTGAEMNHLAKAELSKGNNELVIENISSSVDVNSIQVSCSGNVTVMGTEFSTDYLQSETKSGIQKALEDSLEKINDLAEKNKTSLSILNDLQAVLKANKEIKGSQTGLNVSELVKLMDYYKAKSIDLQNDLAALTQKQKKLA